MPYVTNVSRCLPCRLPDCGRGAHATGSHWAWSPARAPRPGRWSWWWADDHRIGDRRTGLSTSYKAEGGYLVKQMSYLTFRMRFYFTLIWILCVLYTEIIEKPASAIEFFLHLPYFFCKLQRFSPIFGRRVILLCKLPQIFVSALNNYLNGPISINLASRSLVDEHKAKTLICPLALFYLVQNGFALWYPDNWYFSEFVDQHRESLRGLWGCWMQGGQCSGVQIETPCSQTRFKIRNQP